MLSEILSAYSRICVDLTDVQVKKVGVDPALLGFNDATGDFKVRAAQVIWLGNRLFCFGNGENDAGMAAIFVCRNELGDVADLCAWSPADNRLALLEKSVVMLGQEHLREPRLGDSLQVHETPREWLKAERAGVVLIDVVGALPFLYCASPISVVSAKARTELLGRWKPKVPEIEVKEK